MGSSYHWVEKHKLPLAVAFFVGKKGDHAERFENLGRMRDDKVSVRISPGMRNATLVKGMEQVNNLLTSLGMNVDKPINEMSSASLSERIQNLWICNCIKDNAYKIRTRGIIDKCFSCNKESVDAATPDAVQAKAYLLEMERKERSFKHGKGTSGSLALDIREKIFGGGSQ